MIRLLLTNKGFDGYAGSMKRAATLLMAASVAACGGCVQIQAPDKPIEINLNVNIKQEVIVKLQQDASALIKSSPDLFPQ
jgi:YnbE-like lipoprotein